MNNIIKHTSKMIVKAVVNYFLPLIILYKLLEKYESYSEKIKEDIMHHFRKKPHG